MVKNANYQNSMVMWHMNISFVRNPYSSYKYPHLLNYLWNYYPAH